MITGTPPHASGASFQEKSEYILGPGQQDAKHHLQSQCAGSINVLHVGILQVSKVVTPNGLEMLRSPKDNDNVLLIPNFGCRLPLSVIQLPQGQLVWMLGRRLEPNFEQLQTSTKAI